MGFWFPVSHFWTRFPGVGGSQNCGGGCRFPVFPLILGRFLATTKGVGSSDTLFVFIPLLGFLCRIGDTVRVSWDLFCFAPRLFGFPVSLGRLSGFCGLSVLPFGVLSGKRVILGVFGVCLPRILPDFRLWVWIFPVAGHFPGVLQGRY